MSRKGLPIFLIYKPNQKEFYICLEAQGKFLRWCSYYPPTLDVRYARELTRIEDMPLNKRPRKQIYDEGTYTIGKSATRESIESKIIEGIEMKSFSFILNGKILQGRFSIKKNSYNTILQKYKDKFAVEEDVLSGDLARTISTMIPDYDEKKVKLNRPQKIKQAIVREPEVQPVEVAPVEVAPVKVAPVKVAPVKVAPVKVAPVKVAPVEEVTADKKIGRDDYHFAFYASEMEPDICVITNAKAEVMVLKKDKGNWVMQTTPGRTMLTKEKELVAHATALYDVNTE